MTEIELRTYTPTLSDNHLVGSVSTPVITSELRYLYYFVWILTALWWFKSILHHVTPPRQISLLVKDFTPLLACGFGVESTDTEVQMYCFRYKRKSPTKLVYGYSNIDILRCNTLKWFVLSSLKLEDLTLLLMLANISWWDHDFIIQNLIDFG